jgi:2-oxoglutarate ferredoxin oxidoreductase subunit delta
MTSQDETKPANKENKPEKKRKFRGEVYIEIERCKGCGFCVEFCPTHTLMLSESFNSKGYHPPEVVNLDACTGCGLCGMYCPDFAIFGIRIRLDEEGRDIPVDALTNKEE